jgi:hypothetical protein
MTNSRRLPYWALLILMVFACSSQRKPEKLELAEQLLSESEAIAHDVVMEPPSKAAYLVNLCKASAAVRSPRTQDRCLNSFRVAGTKLGDCEGEKRQVESAVALSKTNAALDMRLLGEVLPWCEQFGDPALGDRPDFK